MVSKEQVEEFMVKYFPSCPLCGSNEGWNVSGILKHYVQCKSCGAKWESRNFVTCKELKNMILWEASKDGKGASLLHKEHPVTFWQSLDIEQLAEKEQTFAICDKCGKPIPIGSTYWYDKTKKQLPNKKFCSEKCYKEALTEKMVKAGRLFFKEDMSDSEIKNAIKAHQALPMLDKLRLGGIGGFLASFEVPTIETVKIGLLNAIIETNKIIILQNELILRALKKKEATRED